MEYKLEELIDVSLLQDLQEKLNEIYSFPSAIIDNDGKILTSVAWQELCTQFHRKNPECEKECIKSDQYIISHLREASPAVSYKCPHGLIDNATPIIIDGNHLGNFFTGQFFLEKPDLDFFRNQAKKYDFDEKKYLEAVEKVPIWPQEKLDKYLNFIKGFIEIIAGIGLKNLNEKETNKIIAYREKRNRSILRTAMDGFCCVDLQGNLTEVNEAYCQMCGYSEQELLKMSISDLDAILTPDQIKANNEKIIQEGKVRFISKHRHKNGNLFDVEVCAQHLPEDGGTFVAFIKDITERIKVETDLKESNLRYHAFFEQNPIGVLEIDPETASITDFNNQVCKQLGYTREEFAGLSLFDIEASESKEETKKHIHQLVINRKGDFVTKHRTKQGEIRDTSVSARTIDVNDRKKFLCIWQDITEIKKNEKELIQAKEKAEEHEKRYVKLFEETIDGCAVHSLVFNENNVPIDYITIDVNPAFEKILNVNKYEVIGRKASEILPPDELQKWLDIFADIGMQGGSRDYNNFSPLNQKYFEGNVFSLQKDYFAVVFRDVTDRKKSEFALKESRSKLAESNQVLEGILGHTNMMTVYLDTRFNFIWVNKAYAETCMYEPSYFPGKNHFELYPDEENQAIFQRVVDTGEPYFANAKPFIFFDQQDQGITYWDWSLIPTKDEFGVVNGLVFTLIEVTNRIKAEEEFRKSEEKFKQAFEYAAFSMALVSLHKKFLSVNPAFCEMTGYSIEELLEKTFSDITYPEDIDIGNSLVLELMQGKRDFFWLEKRYMHKNGNIIWGLLSCAIVRNTEKKPLLLIAQIQNITERKKAEEQLIKAKEKAEESDRLKTAFLHNMSHEIRTPMNAIMGFSDLMAKNYNNKPKLELFSNIINQRCTDLLVIINDILDIAKIESGQLPVNIEKCNINSLIDELKIFFIEQQKKLKKEHINLIVRKQSNSEKLIIETDPIKLKQVLINLLSNAFKFTLQGQIIVGYNFDFSDNITFYISDTGIGIPPDKLEYIFERFAQLEQAQNRVYGGTGLGLSIVKGLINLLGGKIWIESEPGNGTTFYFTLPYKPINESDTVETEQVKNIPENVPIHKKVLIVEDDTYNAAYIEEVLLSTGMDLRTVYYGKDAIHMAINESFDLILMDIGLSDIDGYTVIREILKVKPQQKIIAQTAYASGDDKQKSMETGCIDYISKPIKSEALLSMIYNYLS